MKKGLLAALVVGVLAVPVLAKKPWLEKPASQWSEAEANKVLTDSPWVKKETVGVFLDSKARQKNYGDLVRAGSRGAGTAYGASTSEDQQVQQKLFWIQFTWVAQPVRAAYQRLAQLEGRPAPPQQADPGVIQFFARGEGLPFLTNRDDPHIRKTHLKTKTGATVPVQAVLYDENFERNPMLVLLFPSRVDGEPTLSADDKQVQLVLQLGEDKQLKATFKLKDMVIDGELAL